MRDGGNGSLSARPNADDKILLLFFGSKYCAILPKHTVVLVLMLPCFILKQRE